MRLMMIMTLIIVTLRKYDKILSGDDDSVFVFSDFSLHVHTFYTQQIQIYSNDSDANVQFGESLQTIC